MKEELEELRKKLQESSALIYKLVEAGVVVTLSVETLKVSKQIVCDKTISISIPSATMQTEL